MDQLQENSGMVNFVNQTCCCLIAVGAVICRTKHTFALQDVNSYEIYNLARTRPQKGPLRAKRNLAGANPTCNLTAEI